MRVLVIQEKGVSFDLCLGRYLARAGVEPRFLYRNGAAGVRQQRAQSVAADSLPFRGRLDFRTMLRLRNIIREFQPQVIHAHAAKACWLTILAQWPRKRAKLVFLRGAIRRFNPLSPSDRMLFRSEWVDLFHCVSRAVADSLGAMKVPSNRIEVLPNVGYEPAVFEDAEMPPELEREPGRFRIGAIANYRKVKGLEYLVEAADVLLQRGIPFELVMVGKDEGDQLASRTAAAQARTRIKLLGPVPNPWAILRTFDCLAIPSLSEGFGLVAIEAMACGVPIVASRVGGLREIIEDGKTGRLVPPADATQLADAIQEVLSNTQLREDLRRNGLLTFKERFTAEKVSEAHLKMYRRVAGMPSQ